MGSNYLELIKEATEIFQNTYGKSSTLFSAIGYPNYGVAKTAEDLTDWNFKATAKQNVAQLSYTNGKFGEPMEIGPWVGLQFVQLPQGKIELPGAIEILNKNGYTDGFSNAGLGLPMVPDAQPMWWFCVNHIVQGVSASTGEFMPDLFSC